MRRVAVGSHPDALVLDAALRQSLVTVRSLGRAGVRVHAFETTPRPPAFASRYCSSSAQLPPLEDDPTAFVDAVIDHARAHEGAVIITSHDGSIDALARRRVEVDDAGRLALASNPALAAAADKHRTLEVARRLGISVPESVTATSPRQAAAAATAVGYPAVIKPVQSWADDGRTRRRLIATVHLDAGTVEAAAADLLSLQHAAIVQPWLCGEREAVSLLYTADGIRARFAQVARRVDPLLGGQSVVRESIPLRADITEAAEALVRSIDLRGYSEVEFRRDVNGRAMLMEINARLSASVEVAVRAGVDFPRLLYDWARGARIPLTDDYRVGERIRWLGGDVRWLVKTLTHQGDPDAIRPRTALVCFFTDFFRPTHYDYLDTRDLRPLALATQGFLRSALIRTVSRR